MEGEYEEIICKIVAPRLIPCSRDALWADKLVISILRECCKTSHKFGQAALLHSIHALHKAVHDGLTDMFLDGSGQVHYAFQL